MVRYCDSLFCGCCLSRNSCWSMLFYARILAYILTAESCHYTQSVFLRYPLVSVIDPWSHIFVLKSFCRDNATASLNLNEFIASTLSSLPVSSTAFVVSFDCDVPSASNLTLLRSFTHSHFRYDMDDPQPKYNVCVFGRQKLI